MEKEIKCPNCGGNKYSVIDEKTVKCLYCGTRFTIEEDKPAYKEEQVQLQNTKPEPEKFILYNNSHTTIIHHNSQEYTTDQEVLPQLWQSFSEE